MRRRRRIPPNIGEQHVCLTLEEPPNLADVTALGNGGGLGTAYSVTLGRAWATS